jgi:hypothetical protein
MFVGEMAHSARDTQHSTLNAQLSKRKIEIGEAGWRSGARD